MFCWTVSQSRGSDGRCVTLLSCKHACTILTRAKYVPVFAFLNISVTIKIDFDFSTVGFIIESYLETQKYIRNKTSKISFQKTNPAKCFDIVCINICWSGKL